MRRAHVAARQLARRQHRPAALQPAGCWSTRPRRAPRNSASSSDQLRQTLYNAFGSRQISTIFTPSDDYQVILEADQGVPDGSGRRSRGSSSAAPRARTCRWTPWRHQALGRPAHGQPPGAAARRDDLLQSRAGRVARRGGRRDREVERRSACRPRSPPASPAPRSCSRMR